MSKSTIDELIKSEFDECMNLINNAKMPIDTAIYINNNVLKFDYIHKYTKVLKSETTNDIIILLLKKGYCVMCSNVIEH